jgi:hypothetical protein
MKITEIKLEELDRLTAERLGRSYVRCVPLELQHQWQIQSRSVPAMWQNQYAYRMQQLWDLDLQDKHYLEYYGENPKHPFMNL